MENQNRKAFEQAMATITQTKELSVQHRIDVDLLAIDARYQTEERTDRLTAIQSLTDNWTDNLYAPIIVVPHPDEYLFYIVDGYGRWQASQKLTPPRQYLLATVLLGAMDMTYDERLCFEAFHYVNQNKQTVLFTSIHAHGGNIILGDESAMILERMKRKYNIAFTKKCGKRTAGVLGSYSETLKIARTKGEECMTYIFDILTSAGFNREHNGYSVSMVRALRDMYELYSDFRENTKELLSTELRGESIRSIQVSAENKYPKLPYQSALSKYLEDFIVQSITDAKQVRTINKSGKLVEIKSKKAS